MYYVEFGFSSSVSAENWPCRLSFLGLLLKVDLVSPGLRGLHPQEARLAHHHLAQQPLTLLSPSHDSLLRPHDSTQDASGGVCELPRTYSSPHVDPRSSVRTNTLDQETHTCDRVRAFEQTDVGAHRAVGLLPSRHHTHQPASTSAFPASTKPHRVRSWSDLRRRGAWKYKDCRIVLASEPGCVEGDLLDGMRNQTNMSPHTSLLPPLFAGRQ